MIGNLFDIIIVAATDKKSCSVDPSMFKSWKVLEIVASLLNNLSTSLNVCLLTGIAKGINF